MHSHLHLHLCIHACIHAYIHFVRDLLATARSRARKHTCINTHKHTLRGRPIAIAIVFNHLTAQDAPDPPDKAFEIAAEAIANTHAALRPVTTREGPARLTQALRPVLEEILREYADRMTVRTLLDYSAGIEGQYFADFGPGPDALARYVEACSGLRMIHEPGTMRGYNSTSYCIAGAANRSRHRPAFRRSCREPSARTAGHRGILVLRH